MIYSEDRRPEAASKHWYALYTKPRSEFKAAKQLDAVEVTFYLPTYEKISQWSDRKKKITLPLLRGYIFINSDERERILSLEQPSIVRCICENGKPAKIPDWQIDNLKKMLQTETDFYVIDGLVPGIKVRIIDGPFSGVIGVVKDAEVGKTVAVSIELLNRTITAWLPRESKFEVIKDK
jgi:transcription antitermination factor NusG